jgi:phosphoribosylformylglycinamidine cyclo-ligase
MIGAYHKDKMITGAGIKEGQCIVSLKENGFRSNGISSLRKALSKKFGEKWWANPEAKESIQQAAAPSVLYDKFITTLHGWFDADFKPEIAIYGIVHLSGGAIKEKLAKDLLFPKGLGAYIPELFEPPEIMRECARWRGIGDEEFYETWNGGQGMLLILNEKDAEKCLKRAKEFNVHAKISGTITNEPKVTIISKLSKGKEVTYTP